MHIHLHHYYHYPELDAMSEQLDNLTREVSEARSVGASAIALIEGIAQQLRDMANSATELADLKTQVQTLSDDLSGSTDDIAGAVSRNTPTTP